MFPELRNSTGNSVSRSDFYFLYGIYGFVMQYQHMRMVSIYTTVYF